MPSVITAGTATNTALNLTSDTSGELQIRTNNGSTTALTLTTGGNINIPTSGARITGDFSNATPANRLSFQSSTTNGNTVIQAFPNGTASISALLLSSSSNTTNFNYGALLATASEVQLAATYVGSGSFLPLTFATGGSERLRIDTSGNVGIGITPNASQGRLQVLNTSIAGGAPATSGTTDANQLIAFGMGSTQLRFGAYANGTAWIQQSSGGSYATNYSLVLQPNDGNVGIGTASPATKLHVNGSVRLPDGFEVGFGSANTTYWLGDSTNNWHRFFTSNTERMRITSGGLVLVGSTSSSYAYAGTSMRWLGSGGGLLLSQGSTGDVNQLVFFNPNGLVGYINTNGSSTTYATSSDYRLKENIAPMTGALDKVAQLKPVTYNWKVDGSAGQGFIAHELQEVVPDCVTGEKDAVDAEGKPVYQGVDTSFLVATLTAAIQELKTIVDNQKIELDNAKAEIELLKGAQ